MTLDEIKVNQKCKIKKLHSKGIIHRRLGDLGFIPGNIVTCTLISPFKNPKAFKINGILIAIRNEDSRNIEVEKIE